MNNQSRRTFVKTSALALAGAALPARSWGRILGSNDDLRVGVIGLNGRGKNHLSSLAKISGVRVVALCDPDTAVLEKAKASVAGGSCTTYIDMREMFASPDVDAVTIATPNHWHSLAGIWAMQAGKDVYLEKPVSHEIWEGRQLVAAAAKYNLGTRGQPRQDHGVTRVLLQAPRQHRQSCWPAARASDHQLRSVERAGAARAPAPQHEERTGALRLALDLALRQRRRRQSGDPPDGRGALVPRRAGLAESHAERRRPAGLHRRRPDAEYAGHHSRLCDGAADLRGARSSIESGIDRHGRSSSRAIRRPPRSTRKERS